MVLIKKYPVKPVNVFLLESKGSLSAILEN